jgi:hypothetical protein
MIRLLWFAGLLALLADVPALGAPLANTGALDVTILSCASDRLVLPKVSLHAFRLGGKEFLVTPVKKLDATGIYHVITSEAPSIYTLAVSGRSCKSPGPVTVSIFPGYTRHVVVVTTTECCAVPTLYNNALAVSLASGLTARMTDLSDHNIPFRPGIRDGSVVYFDNIPPAKYALEVSAPFVSTCFTIVVPFSTAGYQKLIAFSDIDMMMLPSLFKPNGGSSQSCVSRR